MLGRTGQGFSELPIILQRYEAQQTRRIQVLTVSGYVGRDNTSPYRHRLSDGETKPLPPTRNDNRIGFSIRASQLHVGNIGQNL
jgi:hypothetical protein